MKRLEEIALFTSDIDAALRFYRRLLGNDPVSSQPGETATFIVNGVKLFLHQKSYAEPESGWPADEDHLAFAVDEVDREVETLRASGCTIEVGPRDFYWGRSAYIRDPDGRLVELHQTTAPPGRDGPA